jgi:hypothetical protein
LKEKHWDVTILTVLYVRMGEHRCALAVEPERMPVPVFLKMVSGNVDLKVVSAVRRGQLPCAILVEINVFVALKEELPLVIAKDVWLVRQVKQQSVLLKMDVYVFQLEVIGSVPANVVRFVQKV